MKCQITNVLISYIFIVVYSGVWVGYLLLLFFVLFCGWVGSRDEDNGESYIQF